MHFDDRLATVLSLPASGDALARIQFRQLIDILGRARPAHEFGPLHEAGLEQLRRLARNIPAAERAELIAAADRPIANPRLLAMLVTEEPGVAIAAVRIARLDEAAWIALIPELPVRARGILRHRRDFGPRIEDLLETLGVQDRGLPPVPPERAAITIRDTGPQAFGLGLEAAPGFESEGVLELLSADSIATHAAVQPPPSVSNDNPATQPPADVGIGAIVRRIEEFRKARDSYQAVQGESDSPRLPFGELTAENRRGPAFVDFATDQEGKISWVEGPFAPSFVGTSLIAANDCSETGLTDRFESALVSLFRKRQPLRGKRIDLSGAPAVSGLWLLDGIAQFDPASGRFIGYCGRLRRPAQALASGHATVDDNAASGPSESDRMRQILHELRNPANAIQVAAEIIQQQLYGPAPHEYRALAAAIAGDIAQILAGFDELDRLVKLESGATSLSNGQCDLASTVRQTVTRLRAWTAPRRSDFVLADNVFPIPVGIDPQDVERLVWRLLAALAGAAVPDEHLALAMDQSEGQARIAITLPASLANRSDAALFDISRPETEQPLSAGIFGIGFTLRLAAAEAAAAGGGLKRDSNHIVLTLPGLTLAEPGHSNVVTRSG